MPSGIYIRTEENLRNLSIAQKAVGRTSVPAGCKNTGRTRFKNGYVPWNKGLKGYRAGSVNHLWKGGVTPLYQKIRNSFEYKQWRKSVFERDKYTCVLCGNNKSGNLQADHIKPFASYPSLRLDINNGRTLCIPCHKETKSYMNRYMGEVN